MKLTSGEERGFKALTGLIKLCEPLIKEAGKLPSEVQGDRR